MFNKRVIILFFVGIIFLPSISWSQEETEIDGGKKRPLIPKIARPIDMLNSNNSCSGNDVEIHYCLEGRTLYKPKISFAVQQHRFKWNLREDKFTYTYSERHIIELDERNDVIYYKYKILFDF